MSTQTMPEPKDIADRLWRDPHPGMAVKVDKITRRLAADLLREQADEIERLRAHIFDVHTKAGCSVCAELSDPEAPKVVNR